jgi:hypothetical protein
MLTCLYAYTSTHQYTQEEAGGCGYVHARLRASSVPLCAQSYIFDTRELARAAIRTQNALADAWCRIQVYADIHDKRGLAGARIYRWVGVHTICSSMRIHASMRNPQSGTDEARSRGCIDPIFLWSVSVYACMRVVK